MMFFKIKEILNPEFWGWFLPGYTYIALFYPTSRYLNQVSKIVLAIVFAYISYLIYPEHTLSGVDINTVYLAKISIYALGLACLSSIPFWFASYISGIIQQIAMFNVTATQDTRFVEESDALSVLGVVAVTLISIDTGYLLDTLVMVIRLPEYYTEDFGVFLLIKETLSASSELFLFLLKYIIIYFICEIFLAALGYFFPEMGITSIGETLRATTAVLLCSVFLIKDVYNVFDYGFWGFF